MSDEAAVSHDEIKYFVRIRGTRRNFVEFDFSIGTPEMAVELVMPVEMFREFCQRYKVITISHNESEMIDLERAQWRHGTIEVGQ